MSEGTTVNTSQKIYPKVPLVRRFLAFFVDYVCVYALSLIPIIGMLFAIFYIMFRDGMGFSFMKHRSIGKTLLKLKVITLKTAPPMSPAEITVRRNFFLSIPSLFTLVPVMGLLMSLLAGFFIYLTEGLFVVFNNDGKRLGDILTGTQVVDEELA